MDQLSIGDRVFVSADETSLVHMFGHRVEKAMFDFVEIGWNADGGERALRVSSDHMIYINGVLKPAGSAQAGDSLVWAANSSGVNQHVRVEKVSMVRDAGLYHPHTVQGNLVVDGILTSCYTTLIHSQLVPLWHTILMPIRAVFQSLQLNILGSVLEGGVRGISYIPSQ